ncbi:hypothetical protein [uncultured Roseovarius sp.]|uniref:hypothetical protein n=1 Tax=uncultured Roseovarius sp. TaxID=293344 RepID=UPI000C8982A8|nr:hypothetical protein [Roseovarius sp.]
MNDLNTREDEWSFQVTSDASKRFFIRLLMPKAARTSLIFSDFILGTNDNARALMALHVIKDRFNLPTPRMKIIFRNIYPSYKNEGDYAELVKRHDQIVAIANDYLAQAGLTLENVILQPKEGQFQTEVLIA